MAVTVVLDEELAGQLQQQADAVQVPVGDFAVHILQDVVAKASEPEDRKLLKTLRDFEQRASPPLRASHE